MMKQKSILIVLGAFAVILVFLAIINAQPVPNAPKDKEALPVKCKVLFTTIPNVCTINFDGITKKSGLNGLCDFGYIDSRNAHSVSYTVSKPGYVPKVGVASISSNQVSKSIFIILTSSNTGGGGGGVPSYAYTVVTHPSGCSVTMNGQSKDSGMTGASFTLVAGTYNVTVSKSGYDTESYQVILSSTKTDTITLTATSSGGGGGGGGGGPPPSPPPSPPPEPPEPEPPGSYTYIVITNPSDCEVTIAGITENSGTTGASFTLIDGNYSVTISKQWYETKTYSLTISADTTDSIMLSKTLYSFTVTTEPLYCDVTVTGQGVINSGETGNAVFNLSAGTYIVTVAKEGYESQNRTITIDGPQTQDFSLTYVSTMHTLTVTTSPLNCFVTIGHTEKWSGTTGAVFNLPSGEYTVTVENYGYKAQSRLINLSGPQTEHFTLSIAYTLKVITSPGFCTVTVNGETGNSGYYGAYFTLTPGTYSVHVSRWGWISQTVDVTIISSNVNITVTCPQAVPEEYTGPLEPRATPGTPGFEMLAFFIAFGVTFLLVLEMKRRKK